MEIVLRAVERVFTFLQSTAFVKARLKRFVPREITLASVGVGGAAASIKKEQPLGRARAFPYLLELPEDTVRHCFAFASPEELASWSAVSSRWQLLVQHRALWTAHADALLTWLAQVGLLPPHDLSLASSGRCRLGWSAAEFFMLRLGWRDLAARVAYLSPTGDNNTNTAAALPEGACWPRLRLVVAGALYDLTGFLNQHPGSPEILLNLGGCDGTRRFAEQRAHRGLYVQGNLPLWCLVPADARAPGEANGAPPQVRHVRRSTRTCCDVRDLASKAEAAAAAAAKIPAATAEIAAGGGTGAATAEAVAAQPSAAEAAVEAAADAAQRFWAQSRQGGDACAANCVHCGALACREQALFSLWANRCGVTLQPPPATTSSRSGGGRGAVGGGGDPVETGAPLVRPPVISRCSIAVEHFPLGTLQAFASDKEKKRASDLEQLRRQQRAREAMGNGDTGLEPDRVWFFARGVF
jgi:hypothetical protein